MPSYNVTDPTTGRSITLTGGSEPSEQELEEVFSSLGPLKAEEVPVSAPGETSQFVADQPQQPEPSLLDKGIAGAKAFGVMAGNAIPATIGAIGGSIYGVGQEILGGAPHGSGADEVSRGAQSFSPLSTNDPLANQYMQQAGDALGSLDPGFIGRAAKGATLSSAAARDASQIAKQAPNAAAEAIQSVQNIGKSPIEIEQAKTDIVKSQIEAGKTTNDLATKTIENGKVVNNPSAKKVIDQGFDEGLVQAVSATNPKTRNNILKMVRISEQGKKDSRFAADNRPSDVIGDSLAERIRTLKNINRKAGTEIEVAANDLKDKPVDYESPLAQFKSDIESAGISIDENGKLNFKGSDLEFSPGDKTLISNIYSRAKTLDGSDAYRVHKLKRLIDRTVDYGKGSQKGITNGGESIVKGFRSAVNESLGNSYQKYRDANTKYADTIGELNEFQKAAGPSIDLFGDNAGQALGTKSRTLLSNAQNRIKLKDSIASIDAVAKKYGAEFDDDIITQAMVAEALDRRFGASAKSSLRGDVEAATGNALERSLRGDATLVGLGIETGKAIKNKLTGVNDENTYKALKELLSRNQKQ